VPEPRIAPLEPPFEPEVAALLGRMMPPDTEPLALFRTFARNPAMAEAMQGWGSYELGRDLSVDRRTREIVIDRATARCGAAYEWGVHIAFFAERCGLDEDQVRSTWAGGPDDPCWSERDRTVLRLVDALHDTADVPDDVWAAAAAVFDDAQLLDLVLLAGWYRAIGGVINATRVPAEPWAAVPPGGRS
jgi:alkylhydroperoxidase family enzyme